MNDRAGRFSLVWAAALLLAALPAAAGTLSGVVSNGTTGKVAAGTSVTLIQLQGGMQPVAQTTTDARGHYTFTNAGIGSQPMLVRATYRGVDYLEPIAPGNSTVTVNISVYDPTTNPSAFQVLHQIVALEPQGNSLVVGEEFDIENQTKPPKSYYRAGGSFQFDLPKGANLNQAEAWGPSNMPVVQATTEKGSNQYAITFPFRPGQNGVRFSYRLNYPGNQTTLTLKSPYSVETAMLLAPPAMKIIGDGFSPAGTEHGWAVYTRQGVEANSPVVLSVSGTGPIPSATDDSGSGNGGQGQSASGQSSSGDTVTPVAQALPPRLDSVRWVLIAGFGAMFLLGAFFLWWRSRRELSPAIAGAPSGAALPTPGPTPLAPAPAAAQPAESGERALRQSVDEIKETLFRLELRRQAGTISEEEYSAQRQRMEKALRDLVKG
jgi:hypothetical protein